MLKRWLLYLVALLGCLVFFAAYRGWTAWILLATVTLLPGLSLVLSLPFMLAAKATPQLPDGVTLGEEVPLEVVLTSPLPLLPSRCLYQVTHSITGEIHTVRPGENLPTAHCGHLACRTLGMELYDLLGLFRLRRKFSPQIILIRPKPVATEPPRELERHLAHAWRPKYGGGFAEHHELRLYRPGDSLNQVHWKLSAKTGKFIIREAMIPDCSSVLLTADLNGAPEEVDRKLGKLLWLGRHLLELELSFELRAHTGSGAQSWNISNETELLDALDGLLCCVPAAEAPAQDTESAAPWQFHMGGEADEA